MASTQTPTRGRGKTCLCMLYFGVSWRGSHKQWLKLPFPCLSPCAQKGRAAAESISNLAIKCLQCTKSWHYVGSVSRTQAIFQSDYVVLIIFARNKPSIFQASFPLLFYWNSLQPLVMILLLVSGEHGSSNDLSTEKAFQRKASCLLISDLTYLRDGRQNLQPGCNFWRRTVVTEECFQAQSSLQFLLTPSPSAHGLVWNYSPFESLAAVVLCLSRDIYLSITSLYNLSHVRLSNANASCITGARPNNYSCSSPWEGSSQIKSSLKANPLSCFSKGPHQPLVSGECCAEDSAGIPLSLSLQSSVNTKERAVNLLEYVQHSPLPKHG